MADDNNQDSNSRRPSFEIRKSKSVVFDVQENESPSLILTKDDSGPSVVIDKKSMERDYDLIKKLMEVNKQEYDKRNDQRCKSSQRTSPKRVQSHRSQISLSNASPQRNKTTRRVTDKKSSTLTLDSLQRSKSTPGFARKHKYLRKKQPSSKALKEKTPTKQVKDKNNSDEQINFAKVVTKERRSKTNSKTRSNYNSQGGHESRHNSDKDSNDGSTTTTRSERRKSRRLANLILMKDFEAIKDAYCENAKLFEHLSYEPELQGWAQLAKEFIFKQSNRNIKVFIREVHGTKIQVERDMKKSLDDRIMNMNQQRLKQAIGKEFSRILKIYLRAQKEQQQKQRMESHKAAQLNLSDGMISEPSKPRSSSTSPLDQKPAIKKVSFGPDKKESFDEKEDAALPRAEILEKLALLKKEQSEVEQRLPNVSLNTNDDIHQIRHHVLVYYLPIMSLMDRQNIIKLIKEAEGKVSGTTSQPNEVQSSRKPSREAVIADELKKKKENLEKLATPKIQKPPCRPHALHQFLSKTDGALNPQIIFEQKKTETDKPNDPSEQTKTDQQGLEANAEKAPLRSKSATSTREPLTAEQKLILWAGYQKHSVNELKQGAAILRQEADEMEKRIMRFKFLQQQIKPASQRQFQSSVSQKTGQKNSSSKKNLFTSQDAQLILDKKMPSIEESTYDRSPQWAPQQNGLKHSHANSQSSFHRRGSSLDNQVMADYVKKRQITSNQASFKRQRDQKDLNKKMSFYKAIEEKNRLENRKQDLNDEPNMFDDNVKMLGSENEKMLKESLIDALKTIPQDEIIGQGSSNIKSRAAAIQNSKSPNRQVDFVDSRLSGSNQVDIKINPNQLDGAKRKRKVRDESKEFTMLDGLELSVDRDVNKLPESAILSPNILTDRNVEGTSSMHQSFGMYKNSSRQFLRKSKSHLRLSENSQSSIVQPILGLKHIIHSKTPYDRQLDRYMKKRGRQLDLKYKNSINNSNVSSPQAKKSHNELLLDALKKMHAEKQWKPDESLDALSLQARGEPQMQMDLQKTGDFLEASGDDLQSQIPQNRAINDQRAEEQRRLSTERSLMVDQGAFQVENVDETIQTNEYTAKNLAVKSQQPRNATIESQQPVTIEQKPSQAQTIDVTSSNQRRRQLNPVNQPSEPLRTSRDAQSITESSKYLKHQQLRPVIKSSQNTRNRNSLRKELTHENSALSTDILSVTDDNKNSLHAQVNRNKVMFKRSMSSHNFNHKPKMKMHQNQQRVLSSNRSIIKRVDIQPGTPLSKIKQDLYSGARKRKQQPSSLQVSSSQALLSSTKDRMVIKADHSIKIKTIGTDEQAQEINSRNTTVNQSMKAISNKGLYVRNSLVQNSARVPSDGAQKANQRMTTSTWAQQRKVYGQSLVEQMVPKLATKKAGAFSMSQRNADVMPEEPQVDNFISSNRQTPSALAPSALYESSTETQSQLTKPEAQALPVSKTVGYLAQAHSDKVFFRKLQNGLRISQERKREIRFERPINRILKAVPKDYYNFYVKRRHQQTQTGQQQEATQQHQMINEEHSSQVTADIPK